MSNITTTRRLADELLRRDEREGEGLDRFVLSRRAQNRSWRLISLDLRDVTGLDVTFETLRNWYADSEAPKAPATGHRPALPSRRTAPRRRRDEPTPTAD